MGRKNWTDEKLLFKIKNNKSDNYENIVELRKRGGETTFNECLKLINSNSEKNRYIGIQILSDFGQQPKKYENKILKIFFKLLKNETNYKIISTILNGIRYHKSVINESQIKIISKYKLSKYSEIRIQVINCFLGLENITALDTLIYLTKDKKCQIRDWATFGIGTQIEISSESILKALWARTEDKDYVTRSEAIYGLALRNIVEVELKILEELENDNFDKLILKSINRLRVFKFLPKLKKRKAEERKHKIIDIELVENLEKCILKLDRQQIWGLKMCPNCKSKNKSWYNNQNERVWEWEDWYCLNCDNFAFEEFDKLKKCSNCKQKTFLTLSNKYKDWNWCCNCGLEKLILKK